MKEQIIGTVKSMRQDKTAVCLILDTEEGPIEKWMNLAENVKPEYIYAGSTFEGSCMDDEEGGNRILTFIKCAKKNTFNKSFPRPKFGQKPQRPFQATENNIERVAKELENANEYDVSMRRMNATKAASLIYSGTGKENEFKRLTDEVVKYIESGIWIERPN